MSNKKNIILLLVFLLSFFIGVRAVGGPPVVGDISITTNEDTAFTVTLTSTGVENVAVTYAVETLPSHGTVSISGDQATYTPSLNYNGPDSFTYYATDGNNSNIATVSITVNPVNDPPVADSKSVTTNENTAVGATLTATDPENDPLTYTIVSNPSYGTVTVSGDQATYTPSLNYNGPDSFTYKATDNHNAESNTATVSITINTVNDPPVADSKTATTNEDTAVGVTLTATDPEGDPFIFSIVSDPSHGTVTVSGDQATYTPSLNYNGPDSFTYKATDNQGAAGNPATVSITVNPMNDLPSVPVKIFPINWMNFTDGNIRLTWSASMDVDGDNLRYDWELSNKSDFSATLKSGNTENLNVDLSLPVNTYYWRVRANDSFDKSSWSQSATPDFQVVSAPGIDNIRALIISNSSIKVVWATDQSDSLNRVLYGYNPGLEDGIWSSWKNNTSNPNITIDGLIGQPVYYQVFSYNAINSSAYSNSSIFKFVYPLQVTLYYVEPIIINYNETWLPATRGHIGKVIGIDGYFNNTGDDSLSLTIYNEDICPKLCNVTLNKNENKSFMEISSLGKYDFEIKPAEVKWLDESHGFFNSTLQIKVSGQNSSWAFSYTNTSTTTLPIIPIFKIKRAMDREGKDLGVGGTVVVSEGSTTTVRYILEANSSVNLTNVQICDPYYPEDQNGPCFNILRLEANKPQNISYTYKATSSDLSSMKCEASKYFGIPCIINQATFGADIESTGEHIKDTEYLKLWVGTIPPPTYTSSSGGGGGGGGGGMAPSEDINNIERREIREMDVLFRTASTYLFRSADPVMVVAFESSVSENAVPVAVEVLKNRSKNIKEDAPGKPYKYFNVFVGTSGFSRKVSNGVIAYRINNSWLAENNIDPADISLYKWQGTWVKLDTEIAENRSNYTYYASLTGNFSSFAIAAAREQKIGGGYVSVPDIAAPSEEQQNTTRKITNLSGDKQEYKIPGLSLAAAILVFGIAGIIFYLKKNYKKLNKKEVRK